MSRAARADVRENSLVFDNDETRPIPGRNADDTVIQGSSKADDTVVKPNSDGDATIISGGDATPAPPRVIESPLSDEDRKRFFRPPVGDPGSVVPIPERPVTRPITKIESDPLADEPPKRKSFDEIISGEIHRMTDAIPIIGRNRNGEPRRAIVAIGLVVALAVVAGVVVAAVIYFTVNK